VVLFQNHDSVLKNAGVLSIDAAANRWGLEKTVEKSLRSLEKMSEVLQTRVRSQVDPITLVIRGGKARQQMEVGRLVIVQGAGEERHDLRETITIPHWS
jgi:hypothetical protein